MSSLPSSVIRRALRQCSTRQPLSLRRYSTAVESAAESDSERRRQTDAYLQEVARGAGAQMASRQRKKKPQRPPFAKNLFLGLYDTDLLAYPELEKEDADNLTRTVDNLPDECTDDSTGADFKSFARSLGGHGLVGLRAPQVLGGRDMNVTESVRVLEAVAGHGAVANVVANEFLGVEAVVRFGSEAQKRRYLPELMSGRTVSAFGLLEDQATRQGEFCTKGRLEPGAGTWAVNGEKIWVLNGNAADVFVVLAETGQTIDKGIEHVEVTAFLIDRNQEGVAVSRYPLDSAAGLDMAHLRLSNVSVPQENVLGKVNGGKAVLQAVMSVFRLGCAVPPLVLTRRLLDQLTTFCVQSSGQEMALYETDEVLTLTGEVAMWLYAMESLVYLTTGLMDGYEEQDCELEAVIVKAFNTEHAVRCAHACAGFIGTSSLLKDHWCGVGLQETLKHWTVQESPANLRMTCALMGLQHAGRSLRDTVARVRNPLFNAGFVLRRALAQRRHFADEPRLTLHLDRYLHPSLRRAAARLEYCTLRLQFAAEVLLSRHGAEVVNRHRDLAGLGACAADVAAMGAALARASRAYCVGLRGAHVDVVLAEALCGRLEAAVRRRVGAICADEVDNGDKSARVVGGACFKSGRYFAEHALARNF